MSNNITSVAPARICLYGDHQDYLNLPIIAIAIDRYIKVDAKSNLAEGFYINKLDIKQKDIIDYNIDYNYKGKPEFFRIALKVLKKYGCIPIKDMIFLFQVISLSIQVYQALQHLQLHGFNSCYIHLCLKKKLIIKL